MLPNLTERTLKLRCSTSIQYFEVEAMSSLVVPKPPKSVLICCPGWLGSSHSITQQIGNLRTLSTTLEVGGVCGNSIGVFGIEWRGHGQSDVGKDVAGITVQLLADDLNQLIDHILAETKACKVNLLGHSMGVNVIWRYLDLHGDAKVDRLVFVDQPVAIAGSKLAEATMGYRKEWKIHSVSTAYILAVLLLFKNVVFLPLLSIIGPNWFRGDIVTFFYQCHSNALGHLLVDTVRADNCERIGRIRRPCLVYGGEASFVKPAVAEWIAQRIPGPTRLLIYPAPYGTHAPFLPHICSDQAQGEFGSRRFCLDLLEFLTTDSSMN